MQRDPWKNKGYHTVESRQEGMVGKQVWRFRSLDKVEVSSTS